MKGYVYKWVNNLNGKWYIGSHNGSNQNYKAGGIQINRAFDKYGIENFTKYIIHEGDDYRLVEELSLISHDAANNPMSYNMKNAAIGGKTSGSFQKGRVPTTTTKGMKLPQNSGKNHWSYGKVIPQSTRDKMSESRRGRKQSKSEVIIRVDSMKHKIMVLNQETGIYYDSIADAVRSHNIINLYRKLKGWAINNTPLIIVRKEVVDL